MANHPNRSALQGRLCAKREDGTWAPIAAEIRKYLEDLGLPEGRGSGPHDTARGILAASCHGSAVRGENGRARTILEFSGTMYDMWISGADLPPATGAEGDSSILRAFVNPRDGSINRAALLAAATLYLKQRSDT